MSFNLCASYYRSENVSLIRGLRARAHFGSTTRSSEAKKTFPMSLIEKYIWPACRETNRH